MVLQKSATGADDRTVAGTKILTVKRIPTCLMANGIATAACWEYKGASLCISGMGSKLSRSPVGLPLVTHNRWIDSQSPYHQKYAISGVAAVDPKWWDDIADYLHHADVQTYEQDWPLQHLSTLTGLQQQSLYG